MHAHDFVALLSGLLSHIGLIGCCSCHTAISVTIVDIVLPNRIYPVNSQREGYTGWIILGIVLKIIVGHG